MVYYPSLEYPVTRTVQWRWLGLITYAAAFVVIVLLAVLNAALVGYETVTVFKSDFYATQNFWYDTFMPYRKSKASKLCSTRLFNVGDRFTTNYTIFEWAIQSIETPNAADSGVAYSGSTLSNCDVSAIYFNGDLRSWSIDMSVVVSCKGGGSFDISATTSFTISSLPGKFSPLFGITRVVNANNSQTEGDGRAVVLDRIIRTASEDIGERVYTALQVSNGTSPILLSAAAIFENPCPATKSTADCAKKQPTFVAPDAAMVYSNGALIQNSIDDTTSPRVLDSLTTAPLFNLIQTVYAATRIDMGIDSPNNFLLHKEALPNVLNKTFPVTPSTPANAAGTGLVSHLYTAWDNPSDPNTGYPWMTKFLPLNVTGPASIQVVYLCQFQKLKSPGSFVISVLVAVLSMFSSGWGIYMLLVATAAKRRPEANSCEGHLQDGDHKDGYSSMPMPEPYKS